MIDFEIERSTTNLIYYQFNENLHSGMHFHTNFEFVCVTDGVLMLHIDNKNFELTKGFGALILPSEVHWYETNQYSKSSLCIFSVEYLSEYINLFETSMLDAAAFPFMFTDKLQDLAQQKENLFLQKAFFYYICSCAIKGGIKKITKPKDTNLLYKIINYINNNFKEDITLIQMAKELGYHHIYLSSFLNRNLSIGFSQLVNEHRIEYAKKLLRNSKMNMTEISFECGFFSIRNFNRAFLQFEGYSPKQYKESLTDLKK